jgi:hypothetical protein
MPVAHDPNGPVEKIVLKSSFEEGATCLLTSLQQLHFKDESALILMYPLLSGVLQGKFPVDQLVEHGVSIVGTAILIVQVISMLPHVNG